jgi:hypothetical protein
MVNTAGLVLLPPVIEMAVPVAVQPLKRKPASGAAVTVTCVPCAMLPVPAGSVLTAVPFDPAKTVRGENVSVPVDSSGPITRIPLTWVKSALPLTAPLVMPRRM